MEKESETLDEILSILKDILQKLHYIANDTSAI